MEHQVNNFNPHISTRSNYRSLQSLKMSADPKEDHKKYMRMLNPFTSMEYLLMSPVFTSEYTVCKAACFVNKHMPNMSPLTKSQKMRVPQFYLEVMQSLNFD